MSLHFRRMSTYIGPGPDFGPGPGPGLGPGHGSGPVPGPCPGRGPDPSPGPGPDPRPGPGPGPGPHLAIWYLPSRCCQAVRWQAVYLLLHRPNEHLDKWNQRLLPHCTAAWQGES